MHTVLAVELFVLIVLFMALVYYGVLDILLNRKCQSPHQVRELQFWGLAAVTGVFLCIAFATEGLVQKDIALSGFLVLPLYISSVTFALYHGARRVRDHSVSIRKGLCK